MHSSAEALRKAFKWTIEGKHVAIATVTQTWGSSPCPVGSLMVVSDTSEFSGSVSGGCVEGDVISNALECIDDREFKRLQYDISDNDAFAAGLPCGGAIEVVIQHVGSHFPTKVLRTAVESIEQNRPFVCTIGKSGKTSFGPSGCDKTGSLGDDSFVWVHRAAVRIVAVGAVHIAQELSAFAHRLDIPVIVVDPRETFITQERFPNAICYDQWPDSAFASIGIDNRTAVVVLSHDPKIDDTALLVALSTDALYVGALGSKRNNRKRIERLRLAGCSDKDLARINAPVGLKIGAADAPQIALSIIAEIIATMNR